MTRPTAAPSRFPYPHRTLAEIWAVEARCAASAKGPGDRIDKIVGLSFDPANRSAAARSAMPDRPCLRCGARGWCGHDGRIAADRLEVAA